ncbi:unnamed protein product [Cuscuta campestris]|uniref:Uncharacterized protein n=1 Tax=Cuscuta campestris TaxID=132261 RepID=A0A484MKL7_9ASTE|nr:unnamed protein product [Cuscuta campestris]
MDPDCQTNGRPPVANGRPSPAQPRIAVAIQSTMVDRRSTTVDRHGVPPARRNEGRAYHIICMRKRSCVIASLIA